MSRDFRYGVTNNLVGYWTKEDNKAMRYKDWMSISLNASFDVAAFATDKPKAFEAIHQNFVRGYRTSDTYESLEDQFIKAFSTSSREWWMSYLGKAEMKIYLPHRERQVLKDTIIGVIELLEKREVSMEDWNGHLRIKTEVDTQRKVTKHGGTRSVPVISHQFQQIRPLVVKALADAYSLREPTVQEWRYKPKFTMYL